MKKPALLLSAILTLLVFPAQAAMIVNDHFDGDSLDPSWNIAMSSTTTGWDHQINNSQMKVNQIYSTSSQAPGHVFLSQQFNAIDDFNAEFNFNWDEPDSYTIQTFGIGLYDSDHNFITGIYCNDWWLGGLPRKTIMSDGSTSHHGDLPLSGSGTASMIRENGVVNYYWNGGLLASQQQLKYATSLEIYFYYNPYNGSSQMGDMSVDYVTLEGDPVDLSATPEPGTMMLLGSALGLGAWWQRRRKRNKQV